MVEQLGMGWEGMESGRATCILHQGVAENLKQVEMEWKLERRDAQCKGGMCLLIQGIHCMN